MSLTNPRNLFWSLIILSILGSIVLLYSMRSANIASPIVLDPHNPRSATRQAFQNISTKEIQDIIRLKYQAYGIPGILFANSGFVPFVQSWLCNTASYSGVHERSIIIAQDSKGYELLKDNSFDVTVIDVTNFRSVDGVVNYREVGYWRITGQRLDLLSEILEGESPLLLMEADAFWVSDAFKQPEIHNVSDGVDLGLYNNDGSYGFGFIRILPTSIVRRLFRETRDRYNNALAQLEGKSDSESISILGEQKFFTELILSKKYEIMKTVNLSSQHYTSGTCSI